jgi:multiple sugar transport system substrate-binding protein
LAGGELAFITKTTPRRADAIRFIEFLISVPGQTLGVQPPPGGLRVVRLPVNRRLDAVAADHDPRWATVADAYLHQGKALPMLPNWARVQQIAADGFNSMLARCSTTIEADLERLNAKVDAELDKQRVLAR